MRTDTVRRGKLVGVLLCVAAAVSSCSSGVVPGDGEALIGSQTASVAGSPAATPSASAGPQGTRSPTAPAGSVTDSVAPAATGTAVGSATGTGVHVIDTAGHFSVWMPAKPERTSSPGSYSGYSFTVHLAVVAAPYIALVEGEDVSPAVRPAAFDGVLRSAVTRVSRAADLRVISQSATTFEGHRARRAVFERAGARFEFLTFAYSGSRLYALLAPKGARFAALAASFQPTP
jgi:hypothetical protein